MDDHFNSAFNHKLGERHTPAAASIWPTRARLRFPGGKTAHRKDWIKVKCPEWRETNQWRHEFFAKQK